MADGEVVAKVRHGREVLGQVGPEIPCGTTGLYRLLGPVQVVKRNGQVALAHGKRHAVLGRGEVLNQLGPALYGSEVGRLRLFGPPAPQK